MPTVSERIRGLVLAKGHLFLTMSTSLRRRVAFVERFASLVKNSKF